MGTKWKTAVFLGKSLWGAAFTLLLCAGILFALPATAYAYNEETTTVTPEFEWEVNNADMPEKTVSVSMYMMVMPEYTTSTGFRWFYSFWCADGEFVYSDGTTETANQMVYFFRGENADVVDTYNGYEIWHWAFKLEPGTYLFAEPEGISNVAVLTTSLGSPLHSDGYTEAEEVVVEDGDEIILYSIFGEWKWYSQGPIEDLMAYAQKRTEQLAYGHPELQNTTEAEETVISVEGAETGEDVSQEEAGEEAIEEETAAQGTEDGQDAELEETGEEEEGTAFGGLITALAGIIALVLIIYIVFYMKNNRE